jgi:hypothetical protein
VARNVAATRSTRARTGWLAMDRGAVEDHIHASPATNIAVQIKVWVQPRIGALKANTTNEIPMRVRAFRRVPGAVESKSGLKPSLSSRSKRVPFARTP